MTASTSIISSHWCKRNGVDAARYDSIVNKTPLAAKTNRIISNNAPSHYLDRVKRSASIDDNRIESILDSHLIEMGTLRADNFDTFYEAREAALLARIEQAMGKPIAREVAAQENESASSHAESY